MKKFLVCMILILATSTAFAKGKKREHDGGADIGKRIRMAFSDQTKNYNKTSDQRASDNVYYAYPTIGVFPVNALCLEDEGKTVRTIRPVRGVCLPDENCDDDGVQSGTHTAYLTVPAAEAHANCTEEMSMGDGASVCRHFEFTPVQSAYMVTEEVLIVNGGDDQEYRATGNQSTYSIKACTTR